MSLLSDPDYLIHNLRLSYLRHVEDPYGRRLITFNPLLYESNPYIVAASLADKDKWPELALSSSPQPSDDEDDSGGINDSSGFPGARGLKYTQTIVGPSRTAMGGFGMNVSGKRTSTSSRRKVTLRLSDDTVISDPSTKDAVVAGGPGKSSDTFGKITIEQPTPEANPLPPPPPPPAQFIPKFKGAAEMEARRRARLASRPRIGPLPPEPIKPPMPITINPELSSSSEDEILAESLDVDEDEEDDGDFDDLPEGSDSMDEGDEEFDPDFSATRDSAVDSGSTPFDMILGRPTPDAPTSSGPRNRSRLSPVTEGHSHDTSLLQHGAKPIDKLFEMVPPPPRPSPTPSRSKSQQDQGQQQQLSATAPTSTKPAPSRSQTQPHELTFSRQKVQPIKPAKSALSAMLASSSDVANPFADVYAGVSGLGESASITLKIFFPHARKPAGKPLKVIVRKDATVEEVIGFSLFKYWEENWEPKLDHGLKGEDDPQWAIKLSAVGWDIHIAEDDGEVDDDFPAPDRTKRIATVNMDTYAITEASPERVRENQAKDGEIQRRPARILATPKKSNGGLTVPGLPVPAAVSNPLPSVMNSTVGSFPILSTSMGSSSHGPQIFLRIRATGEKEPVHFSTTIPATAGTYIQEVLEKACNRWHIDPRDYALLLNDNDRSLHIPVDRTVASLAGQRDLILVERSELPKFGDVKKVARTTDPNASIFNRTSEVPVVPFNSTIDFTATYKKYTIYRKMPMLVTRSERTLAIDGDYIHIMPSTSKAKAVFESGKTSSYHISSILACQQAGKSASFKLIVARDRSNKRYDFEAESSKQAAEIVHMIKGLKTSLDTKSGGSTKSKYRRSRAAYK